MTHFRERATAGEDVPVDYAAIEQTLSELWRVEMDGDRAVTRAALWNVVAHARQAEHHAHAGEVLGRVASVIPQRTIVVRADVGRQAELASWISANCHVLAEGKQVCSEEISIVAGGSHVGRVAPLVHALLIPDMPVALWWVGDLPHENASYVDALLEPADRLIVDSSGFDAPGDLQLVERVAKNSVTTPADLNWVRGEEWRIATAAIFDLPEMRARMRSVRSIRVVAEGTSPEFFGEWTESLLFCAWLVVQAGLEPRSVETDLRIEAGPRRGISRVELEMEDAAATIVLDAQRQVLATTIRAGTEFPAGVTRTERKRLDQLIVRELKQLKRDCVLSRVLPMAVELSPRIRQ